MSDIVINCYFARKFPPVFNQNKIYRVLQLISVLQARPPKTISVLAGMLNSTERTVYRYLDLLTDLGFRVVRNEYKQVYIADPVNSGLNDLTAEEAQLIRRLVLSVGRSSRLKDSILQKISIPSGAIPGSKDILQARLGKIVELLQRAMVERKQVVLKKYHSLNANGVSDRLVEPTGFTDNYRSLSAFEPATGKNKYFNIERIMAVEIRKKGFCHEGKHKFSPPDAFGFADGAIKQEVDLLLTLRAATLLKEEYPLTSGFIRQDKKKGYYRLKLSVHHFKPVSRFVFGLPEDIVVNGSSEFNDYLMGRLAVLLKRSMKGAAKTALKAGL